MMKKLGSINKRLYEARLELNLTSKVAAKKLGITSIRLNLIEKGYLDVTKKLQPRFIKLYKLDKDIFTENIRYVTPINPIVEDKKKSKKLTIKLSKKWIKIVSIALVFLNIGALSTGIFLMNRQFDNPRYNWTENFTKFFDTLKTSEKITETTDENIFPRKETHVDPESILKLDTYSTYFGYPVLEELSDDEYATANAAINLYKNDSNCSDAEILFKYTDVVTQSEGEEEIFTKYDEYDFQFTFYNNRKIVYCEFHDRLAEQHNSNDVKFCSCEAMGFLNLDGDNLKLEMRNLTYHLWDEETQETEEFVDKIGGPLHTYYQDDFNEGINTSIKYFDTCFLESYKACDIDLGYKYSETDSTVGLASLVDDLQKISRGYVSGFRWGNILTILGSVFAILFFVVTAISFFCSYLLKEKPKKEIVVNSEAKIYDCVKAKRRLPDDIKISPILPEFVLRICGVAAIFASSLILFLLVYYLLKLDFSHLPEIVSAKSGVINNVLIAGTTLLFFLKMDLYTKKTHKDLLVNIFMLFILGLYYYIFEVVIYHDIIRGQGLIAQFGPIISNIMPGNIIWNLMLYSLIFLFLFTTPNKFKKDKKKLTIYRCLSLIPLLILVFGLLNKFALSKVFNMPYWLHFMFYTKGFLMTVFAVLYLYGLFFTQLHYRKKYGFEVSEIYFNSKRFAFVKNIVASAIIVVLFSIDISFKFLYPNNPLGLGETWAVIFIVPLIMLYRPHIGSRTPLWDKIFMGLYGASMAWGYIGVFALIIPKFDFSDLLATLF